MITTILNKWKTNIFSWVAIVGVILFLPTCTQTRKSESLQSPVSQIYTNQQLSGIPIQIVFEKGTAHNHPLMAIWVEDLAGDYLQTLYVAQSIATGVFNYGDKSSGKWMPGVIRRPAALPYWGHQRNVKAEDGLYLPSSQMPITDAVSGATPPGNFIIHTKLKENIPETFIVLFEINQPWDWNAFWTNNKYPDDTDYKSSAQPALVYSAQINLNDTIKINPLKIIGYSHYSGKDGSLTTDLSTITTASNITGSIYVKEP